MKRPLSLRAHLLIGAALWTVGLFGLGIVTWHVTLGNAQPPALFYKVHSHAPLVALACVALLAAARAERGSVAGLVLVDGGLPLPAPGDDVDPDAVLDATLGPAIERLGRVFPDWAAYEEFWREHPALASDWNDDIVAYLRYDVGADDDGGGGLRSRVVPDAVRADGRDLLTGERRFGAALGQVACPVTLLRAPRGLFDEPQPFQPDDLVHFWSDRVTTTLTDGVVEDVNHYTILMGDRGAPAVAQALDPHVDACSSAP